MTRIDSARGVTVLMVAHVAGMIDLVALPVWVGTLMPHYQLNAQQAGGLVTLFLLGAVLSSLFFAPRFNRMPGRMAAALGFGVAALAFVALSTTRDYGAMAALHALGGMAAGCALSFTHGTMGRSANPHRLFAMAGLSLGVFSIGFLALAPQVVRLAGGSALFQIFAGVMGIALLACAIGFPSSTKQGSGVLSAARRAQAAAPLGAGVWFGILGISCMALTQAMMFSFVERIGVERGFGQERVLAVLIAVGLVNLFPAVLAAWLQRRWSPVRVAMLAPIAQAVLSLTIAESASFTPYAAAACVFVFVMIFAHTFVFGLLAQLDPTGRAVASTPAMLMVGSAIGPVLGGAVVHNFGYPSLGWAVLLVSAVSVFGFHRMGRETQSAGAYALPH